MTTALQRLLKHPHAAVFDKDPVGELAFRLRHQDGASWRVAERVLTATAGQVEHTYDLSATTVSGLASALQADGFEVLSLNPGIAPLSALVLVEAEGSELASNGDRLIAFTSLLWVLLSAYAGEVTEAGRQVREALRQMVITQADGDWLDLWGTLYAVGRNPGEPDASYAPRIPQEAFRIRCNARAIELAIRDATGSDVRIEEPWTQIFKLDQSSLSGPDRFYDGEYIGYHLIKPTAKTNIDWPAVRAIIDRNRAAGVLVLGPELVFGSFVDASAGRLVRGGSTQYLLDEVIYEDRALLDYGALEDVSILNHGAFLRRHFKYSSHIEVPQTYAALAAHIWHDYRNYASGLSYSQYWEESAQSTWASEQAYSWSNFAAIVGSSHTRES